MRENSAPMVNSAPTTTGSIKSGFSCYCNNNQYINSLPKSIVNCWCINYYCNSKKNLISLSQLLSGPSLPRGPSSPACTVYCFQICDKSTYEDTAVKLAWYFSLALQFVRLKNRVSPFALTKHVNAVSLKLHWTACWKKMPLTLLKFLPDIYSPNKTIYEVYLLFFPIISSAVQSSALWLRIARSAMRTLRSVRKTNAQSCVLHNFLGVSPWIVGHIDIAHRYFAHKALSTHCTARNTHSNCTGLTPDENVWKTRNSQFVKYIRLIEEVKKTEISPKILMQYQCTFLKL